MVILGATWLADRWREFWVLLLTVTASRVTFGHLYLLLALSYEMSDGTESFWYKSLEF